VAPLASRRHQKDITVTDETMLWRMRYRIYQGFATHGAPPTIEHLAAGLAIPVDEALSLLHALEARHSVLLTDDRRGVLMANPFSAVPTPFRVTSGNVDYWANCAWDMLGVPAALGRDATVHATYATDDAPAELRVTGGEVSGAEGIVHFLQPFRDWYDDLRST
jgi:hypothetical protein